MPLQLLGTIASSVQKISGSFESIATLSGNGSATSLTFSSIPSTYQHLQIRCFGNDGNGNGSKLRFNSVTSAVYAWHRIIGTGSAVSASGSTSENGIPYVMEFGSNASYYGVSIIDILDYASTTKNKVVRTLTGYDQNGSGDIILSSGLWPNTSAITSITILNAGSVAYSSATRFALYGIKGA